MFRGNCKEKKPEDKASPKFERLDKKWVTVLNPNSTDFVKRNVVPT
jgi:hypothetical protein